jgi:hypothetical protein
MSYAAGPQHVLRPHTARKLMHKVIQEINTNHAAHTNHTNTHTYTGVGAAEAEAESMGIDTVVFHQFSMGGFLFGQVRPILLYSYTPIKPIIDNM